MLSRVQFKNNKIRELKIKMFLNKEQVISICVLRRLNYELRWKIYFFFGVHQLFISNSAKLIFAKCRRISEMYKIYFIPMIHVQSFATVSMFEQENNFCVQFHPILFTFIIVDEYLPWIHQKKFFIFVKHFNISVWLFSMQRWTIVCFSRRFHVFMRNQKSLIQHQERITGRLNTGGKSFSSSILRFVRTPW